MRGRRLVHRRDPEAAERARSVSGSIRGWLGPWRKTEVRRGGLSSCTLWLLAAAACAAPPDLPDPVPETAPEPLPEVRVEQVAAGEAIHPVPVPEAELEALQRGERVTLTATGTDLRALLAALAEAAGVNLVVGPEVQGRVTVHLEDVPAREALDAVIRESGYMISEPLRAPWGPVVFYVVPVNVDDADVETIRARFGVSEELARFLVRARVPRD